MRAGSHRVLLGSLFWFAFFFVAGCGDKQDPECRECIEEPEQNQNSTCIPTTCDQQNFQCGQVDDGCGALLQCGTCSAPETCGGGGIAQRCGRADEPEEAEDTQELDLSVPTDIFDSTSFLYEGENAVQFDVEEGAVNPVRVAVVRGRVLDRSGAPLEGATIRAPRHPEMGYTTSREGGRFDMVFNAGGPVTLRFEAEGHLPVQRRVHAQWREFAGLTEIALTPLDDKVTNIDFSTPLAIAEGSQVDDQWGSRRAAVMIPGNTRARIRNADGDEVELGSVSIRATEYTSNTDGPAAMPGLLPPATAYTYAVEYSVDEAIEAGADHIEFDRPLIHYTENFLDFPVGTPVPMGYFDYDKDAWIPSMDGRVIELIAVESGLALIDVDGNQEAASAARLQEIGIDDLEQANLAELYPPGTSLWRVPIEHFTPWDCNWPYGPPETAIAPSVLPDQQEVESQQATDCASLRDGSIIEVENQVLGERIPLVGTPYSLNYRSNRMQGYGASNSLELQLIGDEIPESLKRVTLEITIAGRTFTTVFDQVQPNQRHEFVWDGIDGFGRQVQGAQPAVIRLGYDYELVYQVPGEFGQSFGRLSGSEIEGGRGREDMTIWQESRVMVGSMRTVDPDDTIGGWSLDIHHVYDPQARTLYLGDGSRRKGYDAGLVIQAVAGRGLFGFQGDDGPAERARMNRPTSIAVAADGSYVFADTANHRIRRVDAQGIITSIAGVGSQGFSGEGALANNARLNNPSGVALDREGRVYIADTGNHRIRMLDLDGRIYTVAGSNGPGDSGDDGPATEARLNAPQGVAVDHDGVILIADTGNHRVRMVSQTGLIYPLAGTGQPGLSGDDGPAAQAQLRSPRDVAVDRHGNIFIADSANHMIRKVGLDNQIVALAGTGQPGTAESGATADQAKFNNPAAIAVDREGNIFVADTDNNVLRRINNQGSVIVLAGTGTPGFNGDHITAAAAQITAPEGVAVLPDGEVLVATTGDNRIRRVQTVLPGFSGDSLVIPSSSGEELYVFDAVGRHLATRDAFLGVILYSFEYDDQGRLVRAIDRHGAALEIERSTQGRVTALIAPHGQRSELATDANGFLSLVQDPQGSLSTLEYQNDGLLVGLTDPEGGQYIFTYDYLGRLIYDEAPDGRSTTLERETTNQGFSISATSTLGRTTRHEMIFGEDFQERLVSFANGSGQSTRTHHDGSQSITSVDGTIIERTFQSDPRWGEQAIYPATETVQTPSGLTQVTTTQRSVVLSDPGDLASIRRFTEEIRINDMVQVREIDVEARTMTTTAPDGVQQVLTYNELARMASIQTPGEGTLVMDYDARGLVSAIHHQADDQIRSTLMQYNDAGLPSRMTTPTGESSELFYTPAGALKTLVQPNGSSLDFTYDLNGNLRSITTAKGATHKMTWTSGGLLESYRAPSINGTEAVTSYEYDLDRALLRRTTPDGRQISYHYNSAGQLTSVERIEGSDLLYYHPDSGYMQAIDTFDGEHNSYLYDGPLLVEKRSEGTVNATLDFYYDDNFRPVGIDLNGESIASVHYDAHGQILSVGEMIPSYDDHGLVNSFVLDGLTTTLQRNGFGELTSIQTEGGLTSFSTELEYGADGRIVTRDERILGTLRQEEFVYDPMGRLSQVYRDGLLAYQYNYDANGNRTFSEDFIRGHSTTSTYDARDRLLTGDGTYQWSETGMLKRWINQQGVREYDYDTFGHLRAVELEDGTDLQYAIDGEGHRVGKFVDGALQLGWIYSDARRLVAEFGSDGAVLSTFVYGMHESAPDYMNRDGARYQLVKDHLGSVRMVVHSQSGAVVQQLDYDPFGRVTLDTNPGFQPFGFAGGHYDHHTGLVRFGARDYDAAVGRWTAPDPLLLAGMQPNLYEYVMSDPINRVDPTGLKLGGLFEAVKSAGNSVKKFYNQQKVESLFEGQVNYLVSSAGKLISSYQIGTDIGNGDFRSAAIRAAKLGLGVPIAAATTAICGAGLGPLALMCGVAVNTAVDWAIDKLAEYFFPPKSPSETDENIAGLIDEINSGPCEPG